MGFEWFAYVEIDATILSRRLPYRREMCDFEL